MNEINNENLNNEEMNNNQPQVEEMAQTTETVVEDNQHQPEIPTAEAGAAPSGQQAEPPHENAQNVPPQQQQYPPYMGAPYNGNMYNQQPQQNNVPPYGYTAYNAAPVFNSQPVSSPVRYTAVNNSEDTAAHNRGMRVFCILLVAVLIMTASCGIGYQLGKNQPSAQNLYGNVDVDLAQKPKDTDENTPAEVYAAVSPSVVGIRVYNSKGAVSDASGVIYSKEGYVVTNDHIYSSVGAPQFKIYMHDGTEYNADYVAGDVISDLAVLKIRDAKDLAVAEFGDSSQTFCGESVAAVGRPSDATANSSITTGIISLTSRRVQTTSSYSARLIQTDSAINPGSSGGALVNMYGQVIGITSSKITGEEYDRIGFAIPTTTVKRVVEQLISDGKVTNRAKLGISYTMVDSVTADINSLGAVGLYVSEVTNDSDLYGKLSSGDIITHVNDIAITNDDVVLDIIEGCYAGDKITVTVFTADGDTVEYSAELKANIGESSYSEVIVSEEEQEGANGGTFDFPFGE